MTPEFFEQLIRSAWFGTVLFAIAVALWALIFQRWEGKRGPQKSSRRTG